MIKKQILSALFLVFVYQISLNAMEKEPLISKVESNQDVFKQKLAALKGSLKIITEIKQTLRGSDFLLCLLYVVVMNKLNKDLCGNFFSNYLCTNNFGIDILLTTVLPALFYVISFAYNDKSSRIVSSLLDSFSFDKEEIKELKQQAKGENQMNEQ